MTMAWSATHSRLKVFYQTLYNKMDGAVNEDSCKFEQPQFDCVGLELFDDIQRISSHQVVSAAQDVSTSCSKYCVQLCNLVMANFRKTTPRLLYFGDLPTPVSS